VAFTIPMLMAKMKKGEPITQLAAYDYIRRQQGLFDERAGGVTFLSRTAFRTEIPLPDNVPIGEYQVDLKLFQNGEMVGEALASFAVVKIGVEDLVVNAATNHSLLYGLTVVSMPFFTGWFASIVFRRD
jgi:uncharacterized protein (TIGR02186 family)